MTTWKMRVETETVPPKKWSKAVDVLIEEIERRLPGRMPVGPGTGANLGALFEIEADTAEEASVLGIRTFEAALELAARGIVKRPAIRRVALTAGDFEPTELLGAIDVARLLGVSRQRVYQLLSSYADFPRPKAELARGSVWSRHDIKAWREERQITVPWIAELNMRVRVQPPRVRPPTKESRDLLVKWVEIMGNRHGIPSEARWINGTELRARFALDSTSRERATDSASDLVTWKAQNANIALQADLDVEFLNIAPLIQP